MFSEYMIVTIFYILGIFISKAFDMSAIFFLALALFIIALIRRILKKQASLKIIVLATIMLFGGFNYFSKIQNDIYREFPEKFVSITGTIVSVAEHTEDGTSFRYTLKPNAISYQDITAKFDTNILFYTDKRLEIGTKITAQGFLDEISGMDNEYEFDFSLYYKGKGIFTQLSANDIRVIGKEFILSTQFITGVLTEKVSNTIYTHFDPDSAPFLQAILTGNKSGFTQGELTPLVRTGVYRVLYSPFIHISLIFFLASALFRDKHRQNNVILTILVLYALLNSSSPTIVKAAGICGLFLFRKQVTGCANKLDVISKILLIMTVADPLLCFNSGFVISAASSIVAYFSYNPIYNRFLQRFRKRKLKSASFWAKTITLWIIFLFGTLPVCAYLFGGVSVYAMLFIIFAQPAIMAILMLSPFMLISFWVFGSAPGLLFVVEMLVRFIAYLPKVAEKLPAYYLYLATPSFVQTLTFYLLWWVYVRWSGFKLKTAQTAVISLLALGIISSSIPFIETNTLSVYFVNVGQGDGAVIRTSKGETLLIDGGGSADYETSYNIGERTFVPYLTSHGVCKIDVAILSHCHKDHAEGIIAAAETLRINTIVMPPTPKDNPWHQKILDIAKEKDIRIEYLLKSDEIHFDSGLIVKFLAPDAITAYDLNNASLVAHISYGEFDALFTGDSSLESYEDYPESIELLKVAHHGSDTSTSKEFLTKTKPQCAVISVGEDNSYNLPSKTVLQNLIDSGTTILRTDKMGDIQIKAKKNGKFTYKTFKGE